MKRFLTVLAVIAVVYGLVFAATNEQTGEYAGSQVVYGVDSNGTIRKIIVDSTGKPVIYGIDSTDTARALYLDITGKPVIYGVDSGGTARAISTDANGKILSLEGVTLGTTTTHRAIVDTNDTYTYGTGDSDKMSCSGYKYALIEVDVAGTSPTWDITPEFGSSLASTYFKGQKRTVSQDERFIVEVDGETEFMVRCDGKTGTTPRVTVFVTPFN